VILSATWQDALKAFESMRTETKPVKFPIGPGQEIVFRVRMLTQGEKDRIEANALRARGRSRNAALSPNEIAALKAETIRVGVVEGPEGFAPTTDAITALPAYIRDGLADAIGTYQDLDADTAEIFR